MIKYNNLSKDELNTIEETMEELIHIAGESPELKFERREIEEAILSKLLPVLDKFKLEGDVRNKIEYLSGKFHPFSLMNDFERKNLSKEEFKKYRTKIKNRETKLQHLLDNPNLCNYCGEKHENISQQLISINRFKEIDRKHRAGTMEPLELPLNNLINCLKYDAAMVKSDIINYIYELCISFEFGKFGKRSDDNDIQDFSDKDKRKQKNADKREDIDVVEKWYDRYGYSSIQFIFV